MEFNTATAKCLGMKKELGGKGLRSICAAFSGNLVLVCDLAALLQHSKNSFIYSFISLDKICIIIIIYNNNQISPPKENKSKEMEVQQTSDVLQNAIKYLNSCK